METTIKHALIILSFLAVIGIVTLLASGCAPVLASVCAGAECGTGSPLYMEGSNTVLLTTAHQLTKSDGADVEVVVRLDPGRIGSGALRRHGDVAKIERYQDYALVLVKGRIGRPMRSCEAAPGERVRVEAAYGSKESRDMRPSVEGRVTAVHGTTFEISAQLWHGSSGAPVVSISRGCVVGIVQRLSGSETVCLAIQRVVK